MLLKKNPIVMHSFISETLQPFHYGKKSTTVSRIFDKIQPQNRIIASQGFQVHIFEFF